MTARVRVVVCGAQERGQREGSEYPVKYEGRLRPHTWMEEAVYVPSHMESDPFNERGILESYLDGWVEPCPRKLTFEQLAYLRDDFLRRHGAAGFRECRPVVNPPHEQQKITGRLLPTILQYCAW